MNLRLKTTSDILAYVSRNRKKGAVVVGFALETEKEEEHGLEKLKNKRIDLIVVNNPLEAGAGFAVDTNRGFILDRDGKRLDLPLMDKEEMAVRLVELAAERFA